MTRKKMKCGKCGRDIDSKLPLLILQGIEFMGKFMPIKALLTFIAKCPYCCEMYGDEESRFDIDTEEIEAEDFNRLMVAGVPVMKQTIRPQDEAEEEEADPEAPSQRKIGFCSEED